MENKKQIKNISHKEKISEVKEKTIPSVVLGKIEPISTALSFSLDEKMLLAGDEFGTIFLFDAKNKKLLQSKKIFTARINAIFSYDSSTFLLATSKGVYTLDLTTWKTKLLFEKQKNLEPSFFYKSNYETIMVSSALVNSRSFDLFDSQLTHKKTVQTSGYFEVSVLANHDQFIFLGTSGGLCKIDVANGDVVLAKRIGEVFSLDVDEENSCLALGVWKEVQFRNIHSLKLIKKIKIPKAGTYDRAYFTKFFDNNKKLLCMGAKGNLITIDLSNDKVISTLLTGRYGPQVVSVSISGKLIAAIGMQGDVLLFENN